jgi:hypothetical protein
MALLLFPSKTMRAFAFVFPKVRLSRQAGNKVSCPDFLILKGFWN